MATYFHGSTSETPSSAEGLQTLYLMNPNYVVPYSDAAQHPTQNMLLVNPNNNTSNTSSTSTNALHLGNFSHAPPPPSPNNNREHHHHHLTGVTIPSSNFLLSNAAADPARSSFLGQHEFSGFHSSAAATTSTAAASRGNNYNLWGSIFDQSASNIMTSTTHTPSSNMGCVIGHSTQIGFHRPNHLSLSLSSQQTPYSSLSGETHAISLANRGGGGDDMRGMHNGVSSMHSVSLGSKYLKATQELLDEVVNVGKGIFKGEESMEGDKKEKMKGNIESTSWVGDGSSCGGGENNNNNDGGKQGVELSTAQRQELQMKKSKLVTMLDEVEQRYRQYHHQMQIVITSFEQAAGVGAAKSYTALALKTISKQFRCLKDAISSQIKTTSKTLGEDDCLGVKVEGSRLRYVDHQLRQQRALQQLGMIQHNAWRPQRGLPERAVSVLRAWLFEHFLHPYPKDSDKVMLAKQTGLTRSQVSNWFINARVRLWKPMVEEMYLEEVKQEPNNSSQDNTTKRSKESSKELWSEANATAQESGAMRLDHINILQSKAESFNNNNNNQTTSPTEISNNSHNSLQSAGFHLADMQSPNKPIRSTSEMQNSPGSILSVDMEMKPRHHGETNNNTIITREGNNNTTKFGIESHGGGGGGFGAFPNMEDIGRFHHHHHHHHHVTDQQSLAPRFHGNGVSLTLGLPHSTENNNNLSLSGTTHQHGFLSQNMHLGMRSTTNNANNEFCGAINTTPPSNSHSGTSYESIDIIQNRKRFAAQLLRDFVA
ncbi:BEL1-like homeodomain protein 1 [Glycine soja]|uniref:BEL1-like homeodomain protein 1 isoform A n=1 Tax=Glycine soja TaxID=3848 RepID=A0A445I2E2_GLYSO|nr:BEL1-like homeodomain protein 1 [Glycine soja]XP_028189776.1 BEL1-like homeodomain protein 1 [Glycine soja]XP_028189777.1 BEL1-like homeodomain protein 1 [Glycine soja]RZB80189.1 BEL1-like homeodomain protein 1 isoform A [Glycine soja]